MTKEKFIKILFQQTDENNDLIQESMWVLKVGDYYSIQNIPFYVREVSFKDLVTGKVIDGELLAGELIKESGHSTIRIYFNSNKVKEVRTFLKQHNCDSEISNNPKLIAVDIPPDVKYEKIRDYLDNGERNGFWDYEEACIAH